MYRVSLFHLSVASDRPKSDPFPESQSMSFSVGLPCVVALLLSHMKRFSNSDLPKKSRVKTILYFSSIASMICIILKDGFRSFHTIPFMPPPLYAIFASVGVFTLSELLEL